MPPAVPLFDGPPSIAGPGFINVTLSRTFLAQRIVAMLRADAERPGGGLPPPALPKRTVCARARVCVCACAYEDV